MQKVTVMIYFFTSQIPELKAFKVRQRQQIIALALSHLSPMNKITLSVCKLAFLAPLFLGLAYFEGWMLLPWLLLAGVSYPLLTTPLENIFALPHLQTAIKEYKQGC
jgi:hypothetical protein